MVRFARLTQKRAIVTRKDARTVDSMPHFRPEDFSSNGRIYLSLSGAGGVVEPMELTDEFATLVASGADLAAEDGDDGVVVGTWTFETFELMYKGEPYSLDLALAQASRAMVEALRNYINAAQPPVLG